MAEYFNGTYWAASEQFKNVWLNQQEWLKALGADEGEIDILRRASRRANLIRTDGNWEFVENITLDDLARILDVLITARIRNSHVINEHAEQSFRNFFQDSLDELDELGLVEFK